MSGRKTTSVSFNTPSLLGFVRTTPVFLGNYSLPDGVKNQFCRTVQVQFLKDIAAVRFGSIDADVQGGSHFLVGLSLGEQLENLALARGQQIVTVRTALLL
jgi:hypothetical protein